MSTKIYRPPDYDRITANTDILDDLPQRHAREELIPRIAKKSRNAVNVTPIYIEYFQRLKVGRRCSCWSVEDSPAGLCHVCFVPGTLVNTENGWIPIEEVKERQKVLSSDGTFRKVIKTFERDYEGIVQEIRTSINTNPIITTPEHPFLVLRGNHKRKGGCSPKLCNKYIENGDGNPKRNHNITLLPSGNWYAQVQIGESRGKGRKTLGTFKTKEEAIQVIDKYRKENYKKGHVLVWDEAKNINKGDWLTPIWNNDIKDIQEIKIPQKPTKYSKTTEVRTSCRNGVTTFKVDEEFLWIMGLYIAEGSAGKRTIQFSLHKKEKEYQNKVITFFEKHGYNTKIYNQPNGNGCAIKIYSTALAEWIPAWIGKKCYNKKIPQELMFLPNNKIWALIKGIYDGDGCKRDQEITQTSEIIALQVIELLHRLGEQPTSSIQKSNTLTPKGNKRKPAYRVGWKKDTNKNKDRRYRWKIENNQFTKVKNVKSLTYKGKVYNLEVEGNHTYNVNGIVVHNCHGVGIVGAYNKRGTKTEIFDVTYPNVSSVNIKPDYGVPTRPVYWTLADTATYGIMTFNMPIMNNVGMLDVLDIKDYQPDGTIITYEIKSPAESTYVTLTEDSITARLANSNLNFKITMTRATPATKLPKLVGIRFSYRLLRLTSLRVDIPRVTESLTLEEFGIYESWTSQNFFLDNTLANVTTEDFLVNLLDNTRWKVIEVRDNKPMGILTSWDLTCRKIQAYEPYAQIPVGELDTTALPPEFIRSIQTDADILAQDNETTSRGDRKPGHRAKDVKVSQAVTIPGATNDPSEPLREV